MTIVDIAKKANVSTATVSRVLNGSPNVSDSLRKKVNQIIEESGYTPNIFAKGMVKGTSQTIGIICPVVHDPVQARYLSYIESNLRAYGFNTELLCNMGRSADKSAYLDILLSHRVDAILMIGITMDEIANPEMFLKVVPVGHTDLFSSVPVFLLLHQAYISSSH